MAGTKKMSYVEPADYFPKELRKKHKIGEYAAPQKKTTTKASTKKTK